MTNKDLFKEAIADAKQVREAALANAKVALEEALTPRLQSMLSTRLQEMEDDYMENEVEDVMKEEDDLEEDFDLSAILAELDAEEVEEGKKEDKEEMKEAEEGEEEGEEEEGEEEEGEGDEEVEVSDMSVEELKDLIKDIISQEIGGDDEMGMDDMEAGEEEMEVGNDEDEINLEELLAELEAMDGNEVEEVSEGKYLTIDANDSDYREEEASGIEDALNDAGVTSKVIVDLTDLVVKLNDKSQLKKAKSILDDLGYQWTLEEAKKSNEDLDEAINTINTLRSELQEVNLLNAKLLYVNKIFKAKNLTESQKVKVIASFDKATTANEAKIIFESLESTLTAVTSNVKSQIKESLGFASKAAGVAPKKQIVEINETISRMQQLAGIIK
jgi:hypothetical protein